MYKYDFEIDVFRCINSLFRKKKFIASITLLFLIIGIGLTLDVGENQYTSVATVYAAADGSYTDAANAVTAMNAYLDVAMSYKVSQRAALILGRSDIDAGDIQKSVVVASSLKKSSSTSSITSFITSSATIISFSATTNDPELSREIADAAAQAYEIEMASILKTDSVRSLDSASIGDLTTNAQIEALKDRLKYMLIGFVLSCGLVVACEVFDTKVRTVREATIKGQLPIIGIIPDNKE